MLYKKNQTNELSMELFKNPTSEYRATPFWSWNCELEEKELLWQIEELKKMGFGGFHMHTRSGMATEYLSDKFMQLVKACTEKAKSEDMLSWLYDEDRYPSGAAGGYVTKIKKFRQRFVRFSPDKLNKIEEKELAIENGSAYLIGIYDIELNSKGELKNYRLIKDDKEAKNVLWYAYCETPQPVGWYNNETYVDTLNKEAMDKFIEITHERYKEVVGEDFGKAIPAIFTDEPQFARKTTLPFAKSKNDVTMPWTGDFDESFKETYGFDIKEKLPELIWELPDNEVSTVRYYYHDHVCERFTEAFADNVGTWCAKNGIALTGHMVEECSLRQQTHAIGEAMRAYRSFEIPGIDMLCNYTEYSTAKQAQSAAHQYGREAVMSELYGVTNWDFDFRGHKFQGDWQAALGITVRVPHLSWVSMKGSAKRDYPASINYQSPWYKEYPYIEDHFARLNTVLTRGEPCVNVAVVHPIESYWLHWGPSENTSDIRKQMDENFENIINWLLFGTVDFDFLCESTLPDLCGDINKKLTVGKMKYSVVLVPSCETLRKTTVDIFNKFIDCGGRVIFAGDAPKYIDAKENKEALLLYNRAEKISFNKYAVLDALKSEREIEIKDHSGNSPEQFIYQLRCDGIYKRLFIAKAKSAVINHYSLQTPTKVIIKIKGEYTPTVMNTLTGELCEISFTAADGFTTVYYDFYENDSLLLSLAPLTESWRSLILDAAEQIGKIDFKSNMKLHLEEENVCLLDMAELSLDGEEFKPTEEILKADRALRKKLGWSDATGNDVQPWVIEKEKISHFVTLRFTVKSKSYLENTSFCAEEIAALSVNGKDVTLKTNGYFVDKSIKKYKMPKLKKGKNVIMAKIPFGKRISLEHCYLTGDFDVILEGCEKTLTKARDTIAFGDITSQGLPFYGGNLSYITEIDLPEKCDLKFNIARYIGALTQVIIDGKKVGNIVFSPYDLYVKNVEAGKHTIEFKLFGNRYNTFGALHNCGVSKWYGPDFWYSENENWCYEYNTKKTGILKSPVIEMYKL